MTAAGQAAEAVAEHIRAVAESAPVPSAEVLHRLRALLAPPPTPDGVEPAADDPQRTGVRT